MLVLTRRPAQSIRIGDDIEITIIASSRNQVRIGINAPPGVKILRDELYSNGLEGKKNDNV